MLLDELLEGLHHDKHDNEHGNGHTHNEDDRSITTQESPTLGMYFVYSFN